MTSLQLSNSGSSRRIVSRWTRSRWLVAGLALGVASSFGYSARATAQDVQVEVQGTNINPQVQAALQQAFQNAFNNMAKHVVRIDPALVNIDPQTHAATFEMMNPSDDTLHATIAAGVTPPRRFAGNGQHAAQAQANGLIDDSASSSSSSGSTSPDTIGQSMSLASWIQGLPPSVVLAPHEKKSVTVHLNVPANAKSGEYAAWIVTTADVVGASQMQGKSGGTQVVFQAGAGGGPRMQAGAKLVYTVGN